MMFFKFQQSAAIFILSASLSALPSLAQTTQTANAQTPPNPALAPVNGKVVEDIVARVNDQIITQSDYDRAAEQLEQEAKQQGHEPAQIVGHEPRKGKGCPPAYGCSETWLYQYFPAVKG